ncbi:TonB-dependent receptor [Bacteroides caecimuris]|uniref:SusC/RagA family TonB-linked outer membrane protein n=1 Tax=Bacteroides caecimuris TaxID=1796613 RepID=UPI00242EB4C5|nr:TonB-dependent receptor [Bacteroides caecimuris]
MKRDRLCFSFLCLCCFLFCALDVQAQQDYWKGQVKDAVSGEPMIGVSVRVKGTGSGTITDFDGNFTVKASKGDILVISYVGYKTLELDLKNKTTLGVISLGEDTETLEEVVVVGYGVQKKVSSVGSIATAKGDDLLKIGSVNSVSEALQGQMPGVVAINSTSKPGADKASLLIRGKSTWGEAEPLVLVDGIERDFNDVDVNEIESISVLKDASATAVYGVKGANGVILLTTKRGLEQKPEISFTANFGFKQPSAAPEWSDYVTSMKQYNRAQANDANWGAMMPESTITAWENAYATGNYGPYNDVFPEVDWWKELVKNVGYEQAYNLNVRGGTKKMSYFVSLGYLHDGDIFNTTKQEDFDPSFSYRRYNWRSNFDFNITSTTKLSFNVAGKMGYQNQPSYYENVDSPDERFFKTFFTAPSNEFPIKYSNGIWGDGLSSDQNIACLMNEGGSRNIKQHQGFYDVILNQKLDFITKGLSLKASLSYTTSSSWTTQIMPGKILGKDDLVAQRTHIRINRVYDYANPIYNADGTITYNYTEKRYPDENALGDLPVGGVYDGFKAYGRKLYYELALNYSRQFGDHDVSALFVFNRKMNESTNTANSGVMNFPAYEEDWVGRVTYNFKERYLAEFNGAYTGSEKFAPGRRFGFFPSASIGWRISEEPWVKKLTKGVLTNLKVRYSYGVVGNDKGATRFNYIQKFEQLSANAQFGKYQTSNWGPLYKEGKLADPDATWEESIKQNIGIEIGLWGKLNFTVDLFDEKRNNILMARNTIPSWADSGIAFPQVNLGKTKNHGLELDIAWNDRIGEFNYYAKFNFAASENRVVFIDDPKNQSEYLKKAGKSIGYVNKYLATGNFQSLDDIYNSAQSTIANGTHNTLIPGDLYYIDYNGDGMIDAKDMVPMKNLNYPTTTLGFTLGGSYKGIGFNMLWYSAMDVYKEAIPSYLWDFPEGNIKAQPNTLNTWTADAPIQSGPVRPSIHVQRSYNSVASTYTYTNHAYLRLKNLEVNYQIPKRWLQPLRLTKLQVYVNGSNLLTFSKGDSRRDPEHSGQNVYPMVRRYNIGFRLGL